MATYESIWNQCLYELMKLARLDDTRTVTMEEVDRLAALVSQEIHLDARNAIMKVVGDAKNSFDKEIPF